MKPRARIVATTLVGVDPVTMLEGPDPRDARRCSRRPASRSTTWTTFEVNEAFASVVLAWEKELRPNPGARQPERRRDRARPSDRLHRRAPHHDRAPRARADRRPLRPDRDVLRRRARHRHHHRAVVAYEGLCSSSPGAAEAAPWGPLPGSLVRSAPRAAARADSETRSRSAPRVALLPPSVASAAVAAQEPPERPAPRRARRRLQRLAGRADAAREPARARGPSCSRSS